MESRTIRKRFLEYFERQGHTVVRSGALVPENDPTLYFVNAGMVPFKDVFTGDQTRDYSRAVSSQKCLRVSGKHNDLEQVGRTPKHHTFFEMLGNFSFGDYFKQDAIRFAWAFLTQEVGLDPERMVATVFAGEAGVPADEEAYACWRDEVGLPEERIYRLGKEDNFWAMGDTGPCGPCSEIHLMADPSVSMADALASGGPAEDERWVEVWNLVFMQFERKVSGELLPLKKTGVDTGMGLERLCALKNGHASTYETDLLMPLIQGVAEQAGVTLGDDPEQDVSLRVIADHARATAFCVADGVFPEKGGREYVLRRIMRRAIRHGKLIGFEEPFFDQVCLAVVDQMGDDYPELRERRELIGKIVVAEETSFRRTLDRGLKKLEQAITTAKEASAEKLEDGFVGDLYATDGFPIDLTRLIAEERQLVVDEEAAQAWVAETHGGGESKVGDAAIATIYKQLSEELPATAFLGYEAEQGTGKVLALLVEGERRERIDASELATAGDDEPPRVEVICDRTPFYARAGGQVGDQGVLIAGDEVRFEVKDTVKPGGALNVHQGRLARGTIAVGDELHLEVDGARRQRIRLNHSATHLLHHALRVVLGPHVAQKGSEVAPGQLRFDFSHFQSMTDAELAEVEQLVNAAIRANDETHTELTRFDEARASGAMALFGERYGDEVRMVCIGETRELCGGTHVRRAGEIGLLRVVSEEALALGVRRVVAITGADAIEHDRQQERLLRQAAGKLKARPDELGDRLEKLLAQLKTQERELAELKKQLATGAGTDRLSQAKEINGIKALLTRVEGGDPRVLREAGDTLRDKLGSGVLVLGGEHQGNATLMVMVSKDLTKRVHAGKLIKELAPVIDGRGGGRPDMAQAGGAAPEKLDDALAKAEELLASM
ncbi:MAG: alanine--tRNA ligase [Proteobacteria bacterium]|nr:MAG: alanine--tRNA ligase [Pseudomonadota bacterium]